MYELTVFVLTVTRENHSLAFVFFILYRFQGSGLGVSRSSDVSIPQASTFVNTFFQAFFRFLSLIPNILVRHSGLFSVFPEQPSCFSGS